MALTYETINMLVKIVSSQPQFYHRNTPSVVSYFIQLNLFHLCKMLFLVLITRYEPFVCAILLVCCDRSLIFKKARGKALLYVVR